MATSRFFRVATEGATTDGRTIERAWIDQMVETYTPATRAARVNIEHVRGIDPSSVFGSYGDVLSLKAGDVELNVGGKTEKRRALYAEIAPLDNLVALTSAKQKLYTSIEVNPNFASTGKAYLMGIAVTDNPASLGTEMLTFCAAQGEKSPLAHRKQHPDNLFTAAEPLELDFAPDAPEDDMPAGGEGLGGLLGLLKSLLGNFTAQGAGPAAASAPTAGAVTAPSAAAAAPAPSAGAAPAAGSEPAVAAFAHQALAFAAKVNATLEKLGERQAATDAALADLRGNLESRPPHGFRQRPGATGGTETLRTDC